MVFHADELILVFWDEKLYLNPEDQNLNIIRISKPVEEDEYYR
jgi:hypothetical protein